MRVTIDLDDNSTLKMIWTAIKGTILCRKLPYKIRKTERGWHLIWKGLKISEEESIEYRRRIGDDENRIKLDEECSKRIKQVLFCEKKVFYYDGIFPMWIGKEGREGIKTCPLCSREVKMSEKRWTEKDKKVIIYHTDGTKCELPLVRK